MCTFRLTFELTIFLSVLYMKPPEIELQVLIIFKIVFALQPVKNMVGHCSFLCRFLSVGRKVV